MHAETLTSGMVAAMRDNSGWTLLGADHAPAIIAFLDGVYKKQAWVSQDDMAASLNAFRQSEGGCFSALKEAKLYIDDWAGNGNISEKNWLHRRIEGDTVKYELTANARQAINIVKSMMSSREATSNMETSFEMLEATAYKLLRIASPTAHDRMQALSMSIAAHKQKIQQMEKEQLKIMQTGEVYVDSSECRTVFESLKRQYTQLMGDIPELVTKLKALQVETQRQLLNLKEEDSKGNAINHIYEQANNIIRNSDAGKNFTSLKNIYVNSTRTERMQELFDKLYDALVILKFDNIDMLENMFSTLCKQIDYVGQLPTA